MLEVAVRRAKNAGRMVAAERRPGGGARRSGNRLYIRPSKMLRRCVRTAARK